MIKKVWEFVRFSLSSLASFVVDYALANALFYWISLPSAVSIVIARVLSSLLNYNLNKRLVFRCGKSRGQLLKYYALVVAVLLLNTGFVELLRFLGLSFALAKIIADSILFVCSYLAQHLWVYPQKS